MKKAKKKSPATHRSGSNEVPAQVVNDLLTLLNSGPLELLETKAKEAIQLWPTQAVGWKAIGLLRLMQGRSADAIEPLTEAVKLAPEDAQLHQNLASALLGLEQFEAAAASYRQALKLNPNYVQAHNNLGIALMNLGQNSESQTCYQQALALKQDFVEAHNNLGNLLKKIGRFEQAEASYRQALALRPGMAEAHHNLGCVLVELRRFAEAEASQRQALALKPDYILAHSELGAMLLNQGRCSEAIACYRQALDLDASLIEALAGLSQALARQIPTWHVPMMNDQLRNDAYFAALKAAIKPDTQVLEIGTGSGLLSMMAAKLGARQVTTCEVVPEIAEVARSIVADNGFTPQVTVVSKISTKMEVGQDMDQRADLLVSELLSSEFLNECVLSSIEDAKHRLLKPGARIIPARGAIQFALFGGDDIAANVRVDQVYGFDLSKFNSLVPTKQLISRNDLNIELLSETITAFSFDFANTDQFPLGERKVIEVPVSKPGRCVGIIQWIKLEMDDTVVFENHPAIKNAASGWQYCVYVFPSPVAVVPGQVALVSAAYNRVNPWFSLLGMK